MKKKFLALIVALVAAFTCSFTFTACKDNYSSENEINSSQSNNSENDEDDKNNGEKDNEQVEDQNVEMTKDELLKALENTVEIQNVTLTYVSDKLRVYEIDLTDAVVYYSAFETINDTIVEERYTSNDKDYKKTDNLWQIQPQSTILNEAEQTIKSSILELIYAFDAIEWSWNGETDVYTFSYSKRFMGDITFDDGFVKQINISWLLDAETIEESCVYDKINTTEVTVPEDLFGYSKDGKMYVTVRYPNGTPVNGLTDEFLFYGVNMAIRIQVAAVFEDGLNGLCLSPVNIDENGQVTIDINNVIDIFDNLDGVIGYAIIVPYAEENGYITGWSGEYGIFTEDTSPQYLFLTLIET